MQTRSVNSVSCPCPSFPVSKEPFPHSRIFLVVSMLHYEIVLWNSLWSYIKAYNEERWKRKEEDGLMIKLNIRMELKTKKTKTDPLLITTGLISPNFGHLYQTCLSSRQLLYGFFYPQWCETGLGCDSFTQLEQDASCSMRSNMLRTHLESMTSPLMLLRTTYVA